MQYMHTLLEKVRLSAFADICQFQTMQLINFQEIRQKINKHANTKEESYLF